MSDQVQLKQLSFFQASEEVDMTTVRQLASDIRACGMWTAPIPVDGETGIIMDGNHRLRAAALLGLTHIPCYLLDYRSSRITVLDWNSDEIFDTSVIYCTVLHKKKTLPYKTTRHLFYPELPPSRIPLDLLHRAPCATDHYAVT